MERLKNRWKQTGTVNRFTAAFLAVMMVLTALTAVIVPQINSVDAADLPGTQAYYDARWAEAKVKAGNLAVGTAYTDYQGNAATTVAEGPWMVDGLKAKYDAGTLSAPWNGTETQPVVDNNVTTSMGQTITAARVYTAEEFTYCLNRGYNFILMKDIDLGGYLGRNWTTAVVPTVPFYGDGNGHTVYNFYQNNDLSFQGLFGRRSDTYIVNMRISNSCLLNTRNQECHSAFFLAGSTGSALENCAVENSYMRAASHISALEQICFSSTIANSYTDNVHIYTTGSSTYGGMGCTGLITNCSVDTKISNTYAINGTVICGGGHAGGFASCVYGCSFTNCFSTIDIYGNSRVGSFIGVLHENGLTETKSVIKNCYSSGKVEGVSSLGGFIGTIEVNEPYSNAVGNYEIEDCYSSSMVGCIEGGHEEGAFIGSFFNQSQIGNPDVFNLTSASLKNCYAIGEVGSIDVDSNSDRTSYKDVGGFTAGIYGQNVTLNNCFYDKQTTAMREWATGDSQSVAGITGMLTTTSTKSGIGMTDANWTALGSAYDNSLGDGYYPQLTVFSNPTTFTNTNWMTQEELNNLIKAYSQASVSTVKLATYDKDYNGNTLPTTTYDTVRDVTARFPLTSDSNIKWERCGVTGSATLATGTGAKSDAFVLDESQTPSDVFELAKQGDTWYGDHPMPGVDWARVSATVGGQVGTRALRICPRVGLEAGLSRYIGKGETYDHANDVQMVYSTGARMTDDNAANDYTYGVYPDDPIESRQQALLNASAYKNLADLTTKYKQAGQNDAFSNVDALYMERTATDLSTGVPTAATAAGAKLNEVIIHEILSENADGTAVIGNKIDLTDAAQAAKWNGNSVFSNDSVHKVYSVQYVWSLADGRFISDTKRIEYPKLTHTVTISVENIEGNKIPGKAYLDAYSISDASGNVDNSIVPSFGSNTKIMDVLANQSHANPAATAWKMTTTAEPIEKVTVTFRSIDGTIERTTEIPADKLPKTAGESYTFAAVSPYRAYELDGDGNVIWTTHEISKNYTITLDTDGMYNIKFDKEYPDYGNNVYIDDVDMDIDVVVVIDTQGQSGAVDDFEVQKTLNAPAEENEIFVFKVEYRGWDAAAAGEVQNTMYARVEVKAGEITAKAVFKDMPIGWYTVTELDSNWRFELNDEALTANNDGASVDTAKGSVTYWVGAKE